MAAARKSGTPPLSPMLRACTNLGRHIQEVADYVQMITSRGSTIAKVKKKIIIPNVSDHVIPDHQSIFSAIHQHLNGSLQR